MTEYYRQKLFEGKAYEIWVVQQLKKKRNLHLEIIDDKVGQYTIGETKQGYEIKYDNIYKESGNLYIEIAEKTDPKNEKYIASGIFRQDNTHTWIIGNFQEAYMFDKKELIDIYNNKEYFGNIIITKTSHGILLNKPLIDKYNIDHINLE